MGGKPPVKVNLHGVNSKSARPSSARSPKKTVYIQKNVGYSGYSGSQSLNLMLWAWMLIKASACPIMVWSSYLPLPARPCQSSKHCLIAVKPLPIGNGIRRARAASSSAAAVAARRNATVRACPFNAGRVCMKSSCKVRAICTVCPIRSRRRGRR